MINFRLGFVLISFLLFSGCGNSEQQAEFDASTETQLVNESDSLSNELSTASDSLEKKMDELQSTLDSLNN